MQESVVFDPIRHSYSIGSRELPSVTQILKAVGCYNAWYSKEEHRLRGEAVHTAFRLICEGKYREEGTHPKIIPFARAAQKFVKDTDYKQIGSECPIGSTRLGYAGTPDGWGHAGSQVWLVEVKSGSAPALAGLQLAAYRPLLAEIGVRVDSIRVIEVSDDETWRPIVFDEPRWGTGWQSVLNVYRMRKDNGMLPKEK